jgi:uncharacterized cupredoxin-like copper-binding protein
VPAATYEDHPFSAGAPGNPKKPSCVVQVVMGDGDGKMWFIPDSIELRKGEHIRFVVRNSGALKREFVLASVNENDAHAEMIKMSGPGASRPECKKRRARQDRRNDLAL